MEQMGFNMTQKNPKIHAWCLGYDVYDFESSSLWLDLDLTCYPRRIQS